MKALLVLLFASTVVADGIWHVYPSVATVPPMTFSAQMNSVYVGSGLKDPDALRERNTIVVESGIDFKIRFGDQSPSYYLRFQEDGSVLFANDTYTFATFYERSSFIGSTFDPTKSSLPVQLTFNYLNIPLGDSIFTLDSVVYLSDGSIVGKVYVTERAGLVGMYIFYNGIERVLLYNGLFDIVNPRNLTNLNLLFPASNSGRHSIMDCANVVYPLRPSVSASVIADMGDTGLDSGMWYVEATEYSGESTPHRFSISQQTRTYLPVTGECYLIADYPFIVRQFNLITTDGSFYLDQNECLKGTDDIIIRYFDGDEDCRGDLTRTLELTLGVQIACMYV